MANVTSTNVYFPEIVWSDLSEKEKTVIDGIEEKEDIEVEDNWVYVRISNTNGDKCLNYLKDVLATFFCVVEDYDNGTYQLYVQEGFNCFYNDSHSLEEEEPIRPEDEDNDRLMKQYEKQRAKWADKYDSLYYTVVEKGKEILNKIFRIVVFKYNKEEIESFSNKYCKGNMDEIIEKANNMSLYNKISVACMSYVAINGNKKDINKLNRFYIYESPAGSPHSENINVRIVSKGDIIPTNDYPGDIYVVSSNDVNGFSSKDRDRWGKLSEDEFLFLEKSVLCKRYKEDNSPKWLNINDDRPYILAVDPDPPVNGYLAHWQKVKKILIKGKEVPYYIFGRDMMGQEWDKRDINVIYSCSLKDLPLKGFGDIFTYLYIDRSAPQSKENMKDSFTIEQNSYINMVKGDVCLVENSFIKEDIFVGFLNTGCIEQEKIKYISSIKITGNNCVVHFEDKSKKEFKVIKSAYDIF